MIMKGLFIKLRNAAIISVVVVILGCLLWLRFAQKIPADILLILFAALSVFLFVLMLFKPTRPTTLKEQVPQVVERSDHLVIVEAIKDVAKLVTTEYFMADIFDKWTIIPKGRIKARVRALCVGKASILAGFDLEKVHPHILPNGRIQLPQPEIISVDFDMDIKYIEKSRLVDMDKDKIRKKWKTEIRDKLVKAAIDKGMFENAQRQLVNIAALKLRCLPENLAIEFEGQKGQPQK